MKSQNLFDLAHGLCSREHNPCNVPALVMWPLEDSCLILKGGAVAGGHITLIISRDDLLRLLSERRLLCSTVISFARPPSIEFTRPGSASRSRATLYGSPSRSMPLAMWPSVYRCWSALGSLREGQARTAWTSCQLTSSRLLKTG